MQPSTMDVVECNLAICLHFIRAAPSVMQPSSCSVLLIDDEPLAQDYLLHCLETHADVALCYEHCADRAVDLALEIDATVVLVDLRMPGTDGFAVVRNLRADSR